MTPAAKASTGSGKGILYVFTSIFDISIFFPIKYKNYKNSNPS